jgi:hypothetical protein
VGAYVKELAGHGSLPDRQRIGISKFDGMRDITIEFSVHKLFW